VGRINACIKAELFHVHRAASEMMTGQG
jgi:hypothetical protein